MKAIVGIILPIKSLKIGIEEYEKGFNVCVPRYGDAASDETRKEKSEILRWLRENSIKPRYMVDPSGLKHYVITGSTNGVARDNSSYRWIVNFNTYNEAVLFLMRWT